MRQTVLLSLLTAAISTVAFACSNSGDSSPPATPASDAPDDNQQEQDLTDGVTRLASKLQDPNYLTTQGDNVYFATTYGFATQEEAEYHHDIWVKGKTGAAKRLYKNIYGASWAMIATKNGIYEINEGTASVERRPLDGSKADGESLVHAIYGQEEVPEVGVVKLAADDDGFVVAERTGDQPTDAGPIVAYSPTGKNETKLGSVPGGATALTVAGANVYVGTAGGDVLSAARSGSGSLKKIASGQGAVGSIVVSGTDVFFGTDKGLFVLRKSATAATKLLAEGAGDLVVVRDLLLYGQRDKGISSVPLAGGATKVVLKTKTPSDAIYTGGALYVTDASLGACKQTEDGQACTWEGSVLRVKY